MSSEAQLEETEHGLVPDGEGWFVLNAHDARWLDRPGRGLRCSFEGERPFAQLGFSLFVLEPGEPIGLYHREAGQEDFLVLQGDAVLIIEGEECPLTRWDFVHCPPRAGHMIVGAGEGRSVVLAVGSRVGYPAPDWISYPVDATALRHGAGVERETSDVAEAYARFAEPRPTRFREGSLP